MGYDSRSGRAMLVVLGVALITLLVGIAWQMGWSRSILRQSPLLHQGLEAAEGRLGRAEYAREAVNAGNHFVGDRPTTGQVPQPEARESAGLFDENTLGLSLSDNHRRKVVFGARIPGRDNGAKTWRFEVPKGRPIDPLLQHRPEYLIDSRFQPERPRP